MTATLSLPPLYAAVAAGAGTDAVARAAELARDGADPATFVWADRPDRLDCAVVLQPEQKLAEARLIVPVAVLALDDAIGAEAPPGLDTDLLWPGTVRANGGRAGAIRLVEAPAADEADVPAWLVVGAGVRIVADPRIEAGELPDETSLREEGCAEATSRGLAEAFARALLHWTDRWLDQGFDAVARHWHHRATKHGAETALAFGGGLVAGTMEGLDESGGLILRTAGGRRTLSLAAALAGRG